MSGRATAMSRPLRIALMLESDGPGGAENVLFQLAEELRSRGHSIVPVGPRDGEGWLGQRLRDSGFLPESYTEGPPPDWRLVRDLMRILRRREVELVHSHDLTMSVYGAAACRLARLPHVMTMHGNMTMTDAWRRRVALRWAFRSGQGAVAVSTATQQQLERDLSLRSGRLGVIRNGIPLQPGDPAPIREELGVGSDELLILAVGNLDPRKGHIHLLEALASLEEEGLSVPWRLAIAGGRGGEERSRLEAFAEAKGLADRVHILIGREDVPNLQAAADIFAMPSLWEGLPLALLEAMLAGTACIASDTSGIPEAIRDGQDGLLVPPGDGSGLATRLRLLLEDDTLRQKIARQGRERALGEFTIGVMADAYESLFEKALHALGRAGRSAT